MFAQTALPSDRFNRKRKGGGLGLLPVSNFFFASSKSSGKKKSKYDVPAILSCSTPTRSQKYVLAKAMRPFRSTRTTPVPVKGMECFGSWGQERYYSTSVASACSSLLHFPARTWTALSAPSKFYK